MSIFQPIGSVRPAIACINFIVICAHFDFALFISNDIEIFNNKQYEDLYYDIKEAVSNFWNL